MVDALTVFAVWTLGTSCAVGLVLVVLIIVMGRIE